MEKLWVRNMTASAKGTVEEPGKNVAQKSGLNRNILDQGWSMFATFLGYKAHERGGRVEFTPAPCVLALPDPGLRPHARQQPPHTGSVLLRGVRLPRACGRRWRNQHKSGQDIAR